MYRRNRVQPHVCIHGWAGYARLVEVPRLQQELGELPPRWLHDDRYPSDACQKVVTETIGKLCEGVGTQWGEQEQVGPLAKFNVKDVIANSLPSL